VPDDAPPVPFDRDPAARIAAAARCTWVSVWVNLVLTVVQIAIGLVGHSAGLVAQGVHSLSDLVADFVVLVANHFGGKDPDEEHPYGHQRFETAASLVLGVLLLAVGAGMLWSVLEALRPGVVVATVHASALWVAIGTLAAKEVLFRYMRAVGERVRSSLLIANAWHARSDAAGSLVVALGVLGNLAGYPLLDPLAAAIVGFLIGKMGWTFAWRALHDLMDGAADRDEVTAIRETLAGTPQVMGVHAVRTRRMGDMIVVDAHLEVDGALTIAQGHAIGAAARDRVLARHRVLDVMVHLDPLPPAS